MMDTTSAQELGGVGSRHWPAYHKARREVGKNGEAEHDIEGFDLPRLPNERRCNCGK